MEHPRKFNKIYWLRLLTFFILALAIILPSIPFFLGASFMSALLYTPCVSGPQTPVDYFESWEEVTVTARVGGTFRGYFFPGTNGAAIIIPPPLGSGSGLSFRKAAMFAQHDYAVFVYDSRRCSGMGPISLGYHEGDEIADALAYLQQREDIDPNRIGIHGFSAAGAASVMAAARLPELNAVIAEGGYDDFVRNSLSNHSSNFPAAAYLFFYRWGTTLSYSWITGLDIEKLSPISVIDQIAPRPILLIYGDAENYRPGYTQQTAAGDNARLWIVPGANHGNYLDVAPEAYEQQTVSFFNETLLNQEMNKNE